MSTIRSFEDLECWKASRQLRLFVAGRVIPNLPPHERFELAVQVRKSSRSVTANLAEGFGRYHYRDNYKFCSNARGSLHETLDHLVTACDEGYISTDALQEGRILFERAKGLLNGYMNYLQKSGEKGSLGEEKGNYMPSQTAWFDHSQRVEADDLLTPNA